MKTVVFYGRYSSANQNEQSIEGQRHVCERFVTVSVCVYIRRLADNSRLSNCINVSFHFVQVYKVQKMYHLVLTNDTRYDII
jgi:hypothetical protein